MLETLTRGQGAFLLGAHLGSFELLSAIGRHRPDLKVAMAMYEAQAGPPQHVLQRGAGAGRPGDHPARTPGCDAAHPRLPGCGQVRRHAGRSHARRCTGAAGARSWAPAALFPGRSHARGRGAAPPRHLHDRPVPRRQPLPRRASARSRTSRSRRPQGREAAVRAAIVRYAQLLEQYCRSDPYNWFNFYDFWQARTRPPDAAPPAAAMSARAFLLALAGLAVAAAASRASRRAATAAPAFDELMALLAARRHGHVSFTEVHEMAMLKAPLTSSGELFYEAPERLEKRTLDPEARDPGARSRRAHRPARAPPARARARRLSAGRAVRGEHPRHARRRSRPRSSATS